MPASTSRPTASTSSSWPFCSQSRPTQTRRAAPGRRDRCSLPRNACSRPQCTTSIRGQCRAVAQRKSWLRPNELIATTKAARAIFSPRRSASGLVELLRAVHREAVAAARRARAPASRPRPRWCRNAHADDVAPRRPQPAHEPARLGKIDEVVRPAAGRRGAPCAAPARSADKSTAERVAKSGQQVDHERTRRRRRST